MFKNLLATIAVSLVAFCGAVAQGEPESPSLNPILQRLSTRYEESEDLAYLFHLARVSVAVGTPSDVEIRLRQLADSEWKMGVDPKDFPDGKLTVNAQRLRDELNSIVKSGASLSQPVLALEDQVLIPEGVAFDAGRRRIYLGSLNATRIASVDVATGTSTDLSLPDDVRGVFYGAKWDANGQTLWILNNQETPAKGTPKLLGWNTINKGWVSVAPEKGQGTELNDLCLTNTHYYVTDSAENRIYFGRIGEELKLLTDLPDLYAPNGIACDAENGVLYVADATGVTRVALDKDEPRTASRRLEVPNGYSLGGIDGLYMWGEKLVGVQNFVGVPKVVVLAPHISLEIPVMPVIYDTFHPNHRIPTTGFVQGNCFYYIANSSMDWLDDKVGSPDKPTILGLALDGNSHSSCRLEN